MCCNKNTGIHQFVPVSFLQTDMQKGVHGRFLDQATSVREAAVELVGKFILIRPELTSQYYDMFSERILDTGISVRKRVIKIFRDICLEQPDFEKIPEMCVRMIRRVNDEEGIKVGLTMCFSMNVMFTTVYLYQTYSGHVANLGKFQRKLAILILQFNYFSLLMVVFYRN